MMNTFDTLRDQLSKLTMYHTTVLALALLAVPAFFLMVVGYIPYSPFTFVISLLLFIGGSYGFNKLFGSLFDVKPHAESAVITGLILVFLFSPPESFADIVTLLIVTAIAMASKYILVYRGKHISNPAAIAVVIASMTQLAFATWWVATPALLPFVLLGSFIILYKTEKLRMGLVFIAVAFGLYVIQLAVSSQISFETVAAFVTSMPLLFLAGYMLSEPQTMAPKRLQQYGVAALVGVLVVTPFSIGVVTMTPALALIVGNAVAFSLGVRQTISLRLVARKQIAHDVMELTFDTKPLRFEPGQYMELSVPHRHMDRNGMRRVFTIIGNSYDTQIRIATKLGDPASSFKKALSTLRNGQKIQGTRIAGDFLLPDHPDTPIIFIAGGIGITPFISFLMSGQKRTMVLFYSVKRTEDIAFVDELRRYDVAVTIFASDDQELPDDSWQRKTGKVEESDIRDAYSVYPSAHVYVSGPPRMVREVVQSAKAAGVSSLHTDHFSGY
jgi:ferredoxin-NADP reductase